MNKMQIASLSIICSATKSLSSKFGV